MTLPESIHGPVGDLRLETFRLDQHGRVVTASYSQPPLNFMTTGLIRDLDLLTRAVDRDASVGAVVLTGGVEDRFVTHADPQELGEIIARPSPQLPRRVLEAAMIALDGALRLPGMARALERAGGPAGEVLVTAHRWKRAILRMNRSAAVYLAAINGAAMGGGQELALACDLRFAADSDRVRMGQVEILAGLIPAGGGAQRLSRMLGTACAVEQVLEGSPLTAAQALELGIVHRLVPPDRLLAETGQVAERLARRSSVAVAALKRSIYFGTDRRLGRALDLDLAGGLAAASTPTLRRNVPTFLSDLERLGDTPLLVEPESWIAGTRVDLFE